MIIGISGNAGSGKDTVAKMIQYYFACKNKSEYCDVVTIKMFLDKYAQISIPKDSGWQIRKFASKLKQMAAILLGCKEKDFESEEFKSSLLPDSFQSDVIWDSEIVRTKYTYRWFLQTLGAEVGRNINKDIWVNSLMAEYKAINQERGVDIGGAIDYSDCKFPNWIISDVRYLNEAKAIKDRNGIILKIVRGAKNKDTHSSEVELDSIYPDWTIYNNDSIEVLYEAVCDFLNIKKFGLCK